MDVNGTGKIIKLPFQHRLMKMVLSNLAGFIISEMIGNGYEKYMLGRLNKPVEPKQLPPPPKTDD
jgi:hypothetical protein